MSPNTRTHTTLTTAVLVWGYRMVVLYITLIAFVPVVDYVGNWVQCLLRVPDGLFHCDPLSLAPGRTTVYNVMLGYALLFVAHTGNRTWPSVQMSFSSWLVFCGMISVSSTAIRVFSTVVFNLPVPIVTRVFMLNATLLCGELLYRIGATLWYEHARVPVPATRAAHGHVLRSGKTYTTRSA